MALKKRIIREKNPINAARAGQGSESVENFLPPVGVVRYITFLLSLNPVLGFLIGMIFSSQPYQGAKNFGKKCYIMAAVGLVILFFIFVLTVINGISGSESAAGFTESYY